MTLRLLNVGIGGAFLLFSFAEPIFAGEPEGKTEKAIQGAGELPVQGKDASGFGAEMGGSHASSESVSDVPEFRNGRAATMTYRRSEAKESMSERRRRAPGFSWGRR